MQHVNADNGPPLIHIYIYIYIYIFSECVLKNIHTTEHSHCIQGQFILIMAFKLKYFTMYVGIRSNLQYGLLGLSKRKDCDLIKHTHVKLNI